MGQRQFVSPEILVHTRNGWQRDVAQRCRPPGGRRRPFDVARPQQQQQSSRACARVQPGESSGRGLLVQRLPSQNRLRHCFHQKSSHDRSRQQRVSRQLLDFSKLVSQIVHFQKECRMLHDAGISSTTHPKTYVWCRFRNFSGCWIEWNNFQISSKTS